MTDALPASASVIQQPVDVPLNLMKWLSLC
jgi:hypothetical protein